MTQHQAISPPPGTEQQICVLRLCNRPASLAASLSWGSARFCSHEHREEAASIKLRELTRIDRLLNRIFLLEAKWLHAFRTYAAARSSTGTLVLFQHEFDLPLKEQQTLPETVPRRLQEVGYCFNSCVHVLEILVGVLAFFAEGSLEVEEVDILHVKSNSSVIVIEDDPDEPRVKYVAGRHTMLKVSSWLGDFYLDPTAPQYGRPQGLQRCDEYLQRYTDLRRQHGPWSCVFGTRYKAMQSRMSTSIPGSEEWYHCIETHTALRSINNVVYQVVKDAGGPSLLREAGDTVWRTVEDTVVNGVDKKLRELRCDMDQIWYSTRLSLWVDFYEEALYRSHDDGNAAIMNALVRMSGQELKP
ncbi:hypothetical protein EKO04_008027 [Ascochyta lentis]|uniref:Uncharacterized protein n=1 Tax=Ascochyta lentis TaxID=205686 RepID=A0A8H7IZT6_9PLEO|nr:hypothetical protein EKO04_008027 [Ascochyta lentis]